MHQKQSEILVLKPTSVFLSFLASQLSESDLPDFNLLQTDTTAYVIPKHHAEDATLDEIENHFPTMFRHEISRWLGAEARNKIESSFFDFLCCFKFEMHSHIIAMETSLEEGGQVLNFKPRAELLTWLKSAVEDQDELADVVERVNLAHLAENSTVLVKKFANTKEIKPFLTQFYKPIFETLMARMSNQRSQWPVVTSYQTFSKFFAIELHTQLIHL